MESVTNDLKFMKNCISCYEHICNNPHDWISNVCESPHLLLWVNIEQITYWPVDKGFTYWPCKVLSVKDSTLEVVFFGDHKFCQVVASDCYLYSGRNSLNDTTGIDLRDMDFALKVIYFLYF